MYMMRPSDRREYGGGGLLPSMAKKRVCATGQGMVFDLSVLVWVYNFV